MRGRVAALLRPDEVAVILRTIDDLAAVSLGLLPEGCRDPLDVITRSDEADRLADEIAARLVWPDDRIAADHDHTRRELADRITAALPDEGTATHDPLLPAPLPRPGRNLLPGVRSPGHARASRLVLRGGRRGQGLPARRVPRGRVRPQGPAALSGVFRAG